MTRYLVTTEDALRKESKVNRRKAMNVAAGAMEGRNTIRKQTAKNIRILNKRISKVPKK